MSVLLDLRTGDPIIRNGDFVRTNDEYGFTQVLDTLLNCQEGSEILNPKYGFDLELAITMNSMGSDVKFLEGLLADALNPEKEKLIKSVNSISGEREGQAAKLRFSVSSILGTTTTLTEEIQNAV